MTRKDLQKKHEDLINAGLKADQVITRSLDWVFNAIGVGAGGWLAWTILGIIGVGLFTQMIGTLVGSVIGFVAMRLFFFFGKFFV